MSVFGVIVRGGIGQTFCGGDFMELKTFAASVGAGMVLGAAAILMMPKQNKVRRAVQKTADAIEEGIEDSVQRIKHC